MTLILMRNILAIMQIFLLWINICKAESYERDEFVEETRKRLNIHEWRSRSEWKHHDEFNLGDAYGINPEDIAKWILEENNSSKFISK